MYIAMNGITDVSKFVNLATQVDGDITCTKGRYAIDGKSIMGMFSVDVSDGIVVEYPESAVAFEEYISQFKIDEAGN